ncbi:MAG: hypothetical protein CUN55_09140 [Phototrophicales bacterium]|nr:MAG: hypothetical protein CUN55_09140 [Phototrophicales bacterium]
MKTFNADGVDVCIESGTWQIVDDVNLVLPTVLFEMKNGSGVIQYVAEYGEAIGLPGTQLATGHVQAVVVGFQSKESRWLLGLHVAIDVDAKPSWVQLVAWPRAANTRYANEAQESGRILAEYIGCPLKIFGVKKMPTARHTGPLERHIRNDIDAQTVSIRAAKIPYPGEHRDMKLEAGRGDNLVIRVGRRASEAAREAPPYQVAEVDTKKKVVKLVPPTGLLGALFAGARGREIGFNQIRNVELRHVIMYDSNIVKAKDNDDLMTEELTVHHEWRIYLTVPNESVLLAATVHESSSDLNRQRAKVRGQTGKLDYVDNVDYYRRLNEEQEEQERAKVWAERSAYLVAAAIGCRLVETQVGEEIR